MTKRTKSLLLLAGSIAGLLLILVVSSIIVLQTAWFTNFVRQKIVAAVEESTGGVVELGSFEFDLWHLTVRVRKFVLHGTEPRTNDPLARVALLEVRLKLLSGLKKAVDVRYVGIDQPRVNFVVFPNGTTNVPQPKVKKPSSQTSPLETVVDVAIGEFQIQNGLLEYTQGSVPFSARGQNLRALLNYNVANPSYAGQLSIDPLVLASGSAPPLNMHVNVPVAIEKDAIRIQQARINTDQTRLLLDTSIENLNAPVIAAQLNASVSLPEMQRSFSLPIDTSAKGAPKILTANLSLRSDAQNKVTQLNAAHLALGGTTFQASGTLDQNRKSAAQFNANFALSELAALLKVNSVQAAGALQAKGSVKLDAQNNYAVDGTLNSRDLSLRSGTTRLGNVGLYSPFHADPYLISLDGLKLNAFGGALAAKLFIEKMQNLSLEANLRDFSIPVFVQTLTGKPLGYDGQIGGSVQARGDLKAKGTTGYRAQVRLGITRGSRGVPINGQFSADYNGANDSIDLNRSFIAMPSTRIDLSGAVDERLDVNLVSHNLNDFLPAANFGSTQPQTSLPVTLQGGVAAIAAQITGKLSAPQITSHMAVDRFAVEQRVFDRLAADLSASPSGAVLQNGLLSRNRLRTTFDASVGLRNWTPVPSSQVSANLTLRNGDVADLLSLAGQSNTPATGDLSADIHVNGKYATPTGSASLQVIKASAYDQPIDRLTVRVDLADQLITLSNLEVASAGGQLNVNGTFQHPRSSFTEGHAMFHVATTGVQLANLRPLVRQAPGIGGAVQLTADAAAELRNNNHQPELQISNVAADLTARGLKIQNQSAGDLSATARTAGGTVNYALGSDFAGSDIKVSGRTSLTKGYTTTADASIRNLSVEKTLAITGQSSIPARGNLSATAHVSGTLQSPDADLNFTLARARVYQEPIDRLQGAVHYTPTLVDIPSIQLVVPAGSLNLTGSFSHPANAFNSGALKLKLNTSDVEVSKIQHLEQAKPGLAGTFWMAADLSANVREQSGRKTMLISNLNADASTDGLRVDRQSLGSLTFRARTAGQNLDYRFDSDLAKSQLHLSGASELSGDYRTNATLTFANIRYTNLYPFIAADPTIPPVFDGTVEGRASVNGPILKTDQLNAQLQLSRLELQTRPRTSPTGAPPNRRVEFHNDGPISVALNKSVLRIESLRIQGPGSTLTASGGMDLEDARSPLNLNLNADANLGVLQDVDRDFYSSGNIGLNATVRGSLGQPLVNGRLDLKNANVNYSASPNGLSNANGVILLNGTNASIQSLTGESGGGKIALSGFIGYTGKAITYNLQAKASKVRVRYSGISATSDAALALTGNSNRSILDGTVTIRRVVYGASSDAGSVLSTAATPPTTPSAPSGLLAGMRLDIRVLTAPDLRVVTTYANRLAVEANLNVRGTAANPGILGRMTVTDGQLVFFGNTYTVNTGTINFYNPNAITPVLNFSLETIAQNVDVVLGVSGPMNNLQLSYRSDPPLSFQQIVQLLATNTTPSDPTIAAHQPTPPQQSLSQMGESAILGQAIANPIASRVQRVFGISQFKIDPSISGNNGQPSARVTLQEKIANNLTFTYITDVTQINSQVIRVEFAFTPALSVASLRDYNGNVSVQFFYKFKVR